MPRALPSIGKRIIIAISNKKVALIAYATSLSSASIVGAIAAIAEPPQIPVPAEWAAQTIASLNVRQKYAVNILAVESADGHINAMPGADYVLQADEKLLILGKTQDVFKLTDQI